MKAQYTQVLDYCLEEVEGLTGKPLSPKADQAYLYADGKGYWIDFTHGSLGTFGERSLDHSVVISCAVLKEPSLKLVYLGRPLKDPLLQEPEMDQFGSPEGATEVLFKREDGQFKYFRSQLFDEKNIEKHNPNFPWKKDRAG
ncbi:hypothetical protein P3339_15960 [Microbulbifer sp. MLAF003]|uniref:hypothetical protein n=1 Tax=Microbulbifer sp. MLAF003 TaxID=3032582 RepID=UPI0024AD0F7A|nr:hypothetical protein [Microbulbifer sp. MLAF003]WHI49938.1 hypothetical protein P3339_15960 [Microbulbifer sp. MLAF003]